MKQDLNGVRTPEDVVRRFDLENIPLIVKSQKEITLEVSKKVNGDEVISAINLTPEEAKITANKIALEGYTTINDGFSVDEQGNMTCNNASITGSAIVNGTNFSVDEQGNMICNDAEIHNVSIVNGNISLTQEQDDTRLPILLTQYDASSNVYNCRIGTAGIRFLRNNIDMVGIYGDRNVDGSGGEVRVRNSAGNSNIILAGSNGNITCVSLTQTSLEEKKKDFEKLKSGLDIVKNVDIYKYHLKDEKETDKKHIGFVIGDKYNYRKEITSKDNDGAELYSMVSVLWRAVQEQQAEIERLKEGKK